MNACGGAIAAASKSAPWAGAEAVAEPAPVWLFAPIGRDARLLRDGLAASVADVRIATDATVLRRALSPAGEIGVLVLTQEALNGDVLAVVGDYLELQPPWSELPILLLVDAVGNTARELGRFQAALPRSRTLVLQRPVRISELESAVQTMRRSRLRQYAVRDHVRRQEALRRELNHRVKNILTTVQALHTLSVGEAADLEAFNESFEGRLAAMGEVHQVLYDADYGESDLDGIVEAIVRPYREVGRVTASGATVVLGPEAAQGLGLIVHELATNAVKYGALGGRGGRVSVRWRRTGERFSLAWTERGGPRVRPPERIGYGTRFIDMTMRGYSGDARFDYSPDGAKVVLEAPLATLERQA